MPVIVVRIIIAAELIAIAGRLLIETDASQATVDIP